MSKRLLSLVAITVTTIAAVIKYYEVNVAGDILLLISGAIWLYFLGMVARDSFARR